MTCISGVRRGTERAGRAHLGPWFAFSASTTACPAVPFMSQHTTRALVAEVSSLGVLRCEKEDGPLVYEMYGEAFADTRRASCRDSEDGCAVGGGARRTYR